jgi:hypothetical protein
MRREEAGEEVAVRHVDLDHVEARVFRHVHGAHEVGLHAIHVFAAHLARHLILRTIRDRRRADERPVPLSKWLAVAFPRALG